MRISVTSTTALLSGLMITAVLGLSSKEATVKHPSQIGTVDEPITLACHTTTTNSVNWWYQPSPGAVIREICVNGELLNGNKYIYSLNHMDYSLTIRSPMLNSSGIYTCAEDNGFGIRHVVQLDIAARQSATVGNPVTLTCGAAVTTQPVNWWYQTSPFTEVTEVCANGEILNGNKRYVWLDTRNFDLTINSTQLKNSGLYTCVEKMGFGDRHFVRLTVLEYVTEDPDGLRGSTSTVSNNDTSTLFIINLVNHKGNMANVTAIAICTSVAGVVICVVIGAVLCRRRFRKTTAQQPTGVENAQTTEPLVPSRSRHRKHLSRINRKLFEHARFWEEALQHASKTGVANFTETARHLFELTHFPKLHRKYIDELTNYVNRKHRDVEIIAGLDLRGFIFALPVAQRLRLPFVPISKFGMISGDGIETIHRDYTSRNGKVMQLEVHKNALEVNQKVIIIDDELGAGGSLKAAVECMQQLQADILECVVVFEIQHFGGLEKVSQTGVTVHSLVRLS